MRESVLDLATGVRDRSRAHIARAITLVESSRPDHREQARALLAELAPQTGSAVRVGVSGIPGAVGSTPIQNVGAYGQERVSILEGLKESDWVVAAGVHVLLDGQKVRPVDRDNRVVALVGKE